MIQIVHDGSNEVRTVCIEYLHAGVCAYQMPSLLMVAAAGLVYIIRRLQQHHR